MPAQLRQFTCITCEAPNTAVRADCRCTSCSRTHQLARKRVTTAAWRERRVTEPKFVLVAPVLCLPSPDPIEQDLVMARARRQAQSESAIHDARRMMALYVDPLLKGKPGRPKTTTAAVQERAA